MTKLLEEAIKKVKDMPATEQDNIATLILDEVAWDIAFENSKSKLSLLAKNALKENAQGNTTSLEEGLK